MSSEAVYSLWCFLGGKSTVFHISIPSKANVAQLKEVIELKKPEYQRVAADAFVLWKLNQPIPVRPARTLAERILSLDIVSVATKLEEPTDKVSVIFPQYPLEDHVHIVVKTTTSAAITSPWFSKSSHSAVFDIDNWAELESTEICDRNSHITTSLNLLEVYPNSLQDCAWHENLSNDDLLQLLKHSNACGAPVLQIFIFNSQGRHTNFAAQLHPSTRVLLQNHFAVPAVFFNGISDINPEYVLKLGNTYFLRQDEQGETVSFNGFYQFYRKLLYARATHVWFSHNMSTRAATYMIANGSTDLKEKILGFVHSQGPDAVIQPFAIDAFLAYNATLDLQKGIMICRKNLMQSEFLQLSQLPNPDIFERLHDSSWRFHLLHEDLAVFGDLFRFLIDAHTQVHKHAFLSTQVEDSVFVSLTFLQSRTCIWKRWVENYIARTNIRINLVYYLASQWDNQTNLTIARLTHQIALEAQRDSSSMITMAAMTMIFLPGSFISAVFSTVFFQDYADERGRNAIRMSPQWWYFPLATIPLTILVFAIWIWWMRLRQRKVKRELDDLTLNSKILEH